MMHAARAATATSSHVRFLAPRLLLFALIALAGNALGPVLRYPEIGSAILFPPYAALAAVLIIARREDWVWYVLIDAAAHFVMHWPRWSMSWVLFATIANTARALTAAVLFTRWIGHRRQLDSIRALGLFLASTVLMAPAVGATLGAADVVLHDQSTAYSMAWRLWFTSNALTGLTMVPAFLGLFACTHRAVSWQTNRARMAEWAGFSLALVGMIVLMTRSSLGSSGWSTYIPIPLLLWGALRFGVAGASATLTALMTTWISNFATGAVAAPADDRVMALQISVVVMSLPVLCLAAIASGRENSARLHQALLASRQDRLAIVDADGVVLEVNDSWKRFAERPGAPPFHQVRPGDSYGDVCRRAAEAGDSIAASVLSGLTRVLTRQNRRIEIEFDETHDGQRKAYAMIVEAIERFDGGAVVTCADITARLQTEMELEDQRRQLSRLSRVAVLGQLSGAFAHELNQPLAAILSNAEAGRQLLKREPVELMELAAILQDIIADDHRAAAVIGRLRDLLKRGERRFEQIDVRELIDDVIALSRTELITRQVRATVRLEPALPPFLGDRIQLHQVLLNLILNGCEAMSGIPVAERALELNVGVADGTLHVSVRDHGPGIRPDMLGRLFEPFLTTKPDGLGLGLSISRTIVAAHGGRLWGENHPGGGATLHCVLPMAMPAVTSVAIETMLEANEPA
jgi:signal transduction histidine kinase/integral membrane sensor domain MASE1